MRKLVLAAALCLVISGTFAARAAETAAVSLGAPGAADAGSTSRPGDATRTVAFRILLQDESGAVAVLEQGKLPGHVGRTAIGYHFERPEGSSAQTGAARVGDALRLHMGVTEDGTTLVGEAVRVAAGGASRAPIALTMTSGQTATMQLSEVGTARTWLELTLVPPGG